MYLIIYSIPNSIHDTKFWKQIIFFFMYPGARFSNRLRHTTGGLDSVAEPEPAHFGWSRSRLEGPAPGSGSSLDEKEKILSSILFVSSNID